MRRVRLLVLGTVLFGAISGCAYGDRSTASAPGQPSPQAAESGRTITLAFRFEPTDLSAKIVKPGSGGTPEPLFNAALVMVDNQRNPIPHLAEALPRLNTESWRLFPDGRMETTYKLRPNLTWHDGARLTADDFVFAYRVYAFPALGVFQSKPQDQIEEVAAADARTIVIRWRSPYADAGILDQGTLDPLPAHILSEAFQGMEQDPGTRESFLNLPFWTSAYVGAGPYRMVRWEPGTELEGVAFAGHALGKPRIERVIARIMADDNTTLTNVLSDAVQLAQYYTLRFEQAQVLRRDWVAPGQGIILLDPSSIPASIVQYRTEFLKTPALLDLRVRRALAYSMDRQSLQDALFEGEGVVSHTFITPRESYFADVDQRITKYPYNPRMTEQLMTEAGFVKDRDSLFADASGERFRPEFQAQSGSQFERHQSIMADTWKRSGIEVQPTILPANLSRNNQTRTSFPGLGHTVFGNRGAEENLISVQIGTAANRWVGTNRGGWSNAEYDRLWEGYNLALDPSERQRNMVQMAVMASEEVPALFLYYNFNVLAYSAALHGPTLPGPGSTNFWNVHEWTLQ